MALNELASIDVAIIGAGAAGLAAGRYLRDQHPDLKIHILEAGTRIGGRVSVRDDLQPDDSSGRAQREPNTDVQ